MSFFKTLFASLTAPAAPHHPYRSPGRRLSVVEQTASMVRDPHAQQLAARDGLQIVDVTWEDTARYQGSCVGPNISDMTIQVRDGGRMVCMPVIRHPNFADKTADISIDDLSLRVGNERGGTLERVTLRSYLSDLRRYLSRPRSWRGTSRSLLTPRDREVLVSAQACFLPVPRDGEATFNPVLFNYQSRAGSPAVLAVVASRQGTSATVIDNQRDGFAAGAAWGQQLFFNDAGERARFTGSRLTEFVAGGGDASDSPVDLESAKRAGLSCVLLIQVPLKPRIVQPTLFGPPPPAGPPPGSVYRTSAACASLAGDMGCDVDEAVIGHSEAEGPFTEIDGFPIERDPRFPIRVTVQFYKATSNGVVDGPTMDEIAEQIRAVYADASWIGSLVTDPSDGRTTAW